MLALIVVLMLAVMLVGGAVAASRVPAVSIALFAGIAGGFIGYAVSIEHGRRGVPADVAMWASCALLVGGVLGLFVAPARGSRRSLRRAAWIVLGAAPAAAAVLLLLLRDACPLYVTQGSGFCYYDVDVLGGWSSGVAALFVIDLIVIATLLLLSARRVAEP